MIRGYRGIIFAVAGLALIGAAPSPNSKTSDQANQSIAKIESALDSISAAQNTLAESSETGEYQTPCDPAKPNYKSDLCAQWFAASAARDAADWAFWAVVVGLIGAVGIVAALCLTIDSNRIARDTAKRQLRAYIGVDSAGLVKFKPVAGDDANRRIVISFKNFGQTPASIDFATLDVSFMGGSSIIAPKPAVNIALRDVQINPSESKEIAFAFSVDAQQHNALEFGIIHLVPHGMIVWVDIFGDRTETPFNYICSGAEYIEGRMRTHQAT